MTWWIVGGIVLVAFVFMLFAVGRALGSLGRLAVVMRTTHTRLTAGQQRLEPKLLALRAKVDSLEESMLAARERAAVIEARRGDG